jgi:hypothetical protein
MSSISATVPASRVSAWEVSLFHLYLLRAAYLLLVVGLSTSVWPALIHHQSWPLTLSPWRGIGTSLIAALPILAIFGLRYPLKMLPLLIYEVTWKTIWLIAVALPVWVNHGAIDDALAATIQACLFVMPFYLIIPWRYVFENFALQAGDRWK